MDDTVLKFHQALDACAFTDQHLPGLAEILTDQKISVVPVAEDTTKLEDITPKKWPLHVYLDRAKAEEKKDDLLKGFAGWSITSVQPQPFTNLCNMELDGELIQWTDYQAKVLVAMAVAKAMGWASLYLSPDTKYPVLRMHADALKGRVPEQIEKLIELLSPNAQEITEQVAEQV